ncbi:hypothetical protein HRI_002239100 [Hibiscus trionum]|uniref:Formin-like protein n=1 Tax=Hibiscus trionum TaxID=183268 RepID=A0A9W7M2U1_HIBTR|nr:hypothetical protein HRI_002239100 [Hibiscus trionum]
MLPSSFSTATFFFFFFFFCWLFSSCETLHIPTRRILHEPYSTLSSPPTPKYPLSSSSPGSPFFPSFPSAPFPANISSLVIPHTPAPKHNSQKLLIVAVAAILSASVVACIIAFVYCRRRRQGHSCFDDNKTVTSDDSGGRLNFYHNENNNNNNNVGVRKQRTTSTTSSEFLYLGTVVNSQGRFDDGSNDSPDNAGLDPGKMYSPELRPLPPLSRQNTGRNFRDGEVDSVTEDDGDEEEEFYSPRGSLGGRESSTGTGSESRRVFTAIDVKTNESSSSSTCSCSSSSSGSPARSQSLSISPPVSSSPRRPDPKSPEPVHIQPHLSPERMLIDSPRVSDASINGHIRSPPLSLTSTSPERVQSPSLSSPNRVLIKKLDASIQNFKDFVQNMKVPLILASADGTNSPAKHAPSNDSSVCSASTSPDRALNEDKQQSPLPNGVFVESPEMSPLQVDSLDYNKAPSLSSLASSSPERGLEKSPDASPLRLSNALRKPVLSPPPPPPLPKQRRLWEKPVSSVPFAQQISKPPVPPPPPRRLWEKPVSSVPFARQMPPPPPPPPKQRRLWEKPVSSVPSAQQISKPPPPLIPSSTTFKVSPLEMPTRSESEAIEESEEGSKPKLKPLHWDKVRASSDREMVWDHLRSSSFKLNEEMIETLFVVNTPNSKSKQTTPPSVVPSPNQENRVLDPQKAQNIAILLKALNVTVEEVSDALLEGNADALGTELLESLSRMAPTKEEESKLKEYRDDSPVKLGPAEKFLKTVLDIPFAFKRLDAMLYIANFESEIEYLKNSFETLEAACEELRNSRLFLKLLEAVLKTGNRMNVGTNRGDAQAFKLDTLLKLVDVKGADGKTTLLHFVVQEMIRTEGARLSNANHSTTTSSTLTEDARCRKLGLQVVSGLSSELTNVKKAAAMDSEVLSGDVCKLSRGLEHIGEVLRLNEAMGSDESKEQFPESMSRFMKKAEQEIPRIQAQENVALSLVKEITEYFHGNSAKEEAHPFRIFLVVRDFLTVLDRVCKEAGTINEQTIVSSAHKFPVPVNPIMQQTFPVPVNPMMPHVFPGLQGNPHYGADD